MRMLVSVLLVSFSFVVLVPRVDAQTSHAAPQSALDAALQQHVASTDADRETVLRLLDRPEVQAVAGDIGLDLRRAKDAMTTVDAGTVAGLATQAQQVEQGLAGGQSITISTTLIIIALLVLILIIVAV